MMSAIQVRTIRAAIDNLVAVVDVHRVLQAILVDRGRERYRHVRPELCWKTFQLFAVSQKEIIVRRLARLDGQDRILIEVSE